MGYNPGREDVVSGNIPVSEKSDAVVLVHGLWMTGTEMRVLGGRLEESGFRVRYFRYRSWRGGLAQAASSLREFIEGSERERLHLVGHSLGGVVIAKMLEEAPLSRPGRVAMLGSPMGGSAAARIVSRRTGRAMARRRRDPGGDRRTFAEVAGRQGTSRRRRRHPIGVGSSPRPSKSPTTASSVSKRRASKEPGRSPFGRPTSGCSCHGKWPRSLPTTFARRRKGSPARQLRGESAAGKLRHDRLPVVALDLDHPVLCRSPGAAASLQLRRKVP